jgi:hypothetical protein
MAPVRSESGWLYIDSTGTPIPGLTGFENAKEFNEGLAPVKVGDKWRFITAKGVQSFPQEYYNASSFSGHLAPVQQEENGKFGFIDHTGQFVVRPAFDDAKPFAEGLAAVRWNIERERVGSHLNLQHFRSNRSRVFAAPEKRAVPALSSSFL